MLIMQSLACIPILVFRTMIKYFLSFPISAPPSTQGLSTRQDDDVIIGASIAAGIALFIIISVVGVLCLACIVIRKKKVYKKYVLPYRTYMYGKAIFMPHHEYYFIL